MDVVLIHGMGRTPLSMLRLRRRLRRAGHRAILFGYSPTFESLDGATARLVRLIGRRVRSPRYALVGHSLGAVIIRNALGRLRDRAPTACCFLAPPMVACKAARFFSRFWLYRLLTGEMGQLLADSAFMQQLPLPAAPTRIYAGTGGPRAAWLPFGMQPNDGILSVPEATGAFSGEVVEVPSIHTFIMHSKTVAADLVHFLDRLKGPAGHPRGILLREPDE
jgi:pimeloyl-ACP methyl ester carboxylesterase